MRILNLRNDIGPSLVLIFIFYIKLFLYDGLILAHLPNLVVILKGQGEEETNGLTHGCDQKPPHFLANDLARLLIRQVHRILHLGKLQASSG